MMTGRSTCAVLRMVTRSDGLCRPLSQRCSDHRTSIPAGMYAFRRSKQCEFLPINLGPETDEAHLVIWKGFAEPAFAGERDR